MSYNVGVQCCRFCQRLMDAEFARQHLCLGSVLQTLWYNENIMTCRVCGHRRSKFHCGSRSVAASDANEYVCFCPPELRLPFISDEALADLIKLSTPERS